MRYADTYKMQVSDVGSRSWTSWYTGSLEEVQKFFVDHGWEYLSMGMQVRIVRVVPETGVVHSVLEYHIGKEIK